MTDFVCYPKADLGFDPTPRPSHCLHPMSGMGGPFALPDGALAEVEFCCRCHAVRPRVDAPEERGGRSPEQRGAARRRGGVA